MWAMHRQHSQALHPRTASLEPLDWWEEREERTRTRTPDKRERTQSSRSESRRSLSPLSRTPPRKVVKRERSPEPATPSLGSLGESPGLLLSPLHTSAEASPALEGRGALGS